MTFKKCTKCHCEKNILDFYKKKTGKDGFSAECKNCFNIRSKKWSDANKQKRLLIAKKYRERNKLKIAVLGKNYRENNQEKIIEWKLNNKERQKFLAHRWYLNNPEKRITSEENKKLKKYHVASLTRNYIITALHMIGVSAKQIPPYLIDLKREQMKLTRLIKEKQI